MSSKTKDLTRGPLAAQILVFSLPLMLSNVLQVLFNMADIAVVGRFAGAEALGSVGSTAILVTLFTGFLIGIGSGVNVLVARHLGSRSEGAVRETVHTAALLCLMIGGAILLVGQLITRPLLALLGTKDVLIDGATTYLRIYFLGMPAVAVFNFGNAVYSAAGDTRRPLYFLSVAGVVNVGLNVLMVSGLKMDVDGVATASVIAQYLSAALIVGALMRSRECFRLQVRALRISPDKARTILALGIPSGIQNATFALANLFIQGGVNSFDAVMVEGNSAATNADGLIYDVMAAFYVACTSFMGQNLGAGNRKRALNSYLISTAYSFGIAAILGALLVVFGKEFMYLFTTEAEVVEAGMQKIRIMGMSYCVSAFMDCTIAASRGMGKSVVPMVLVMLGSCVFRVIWVFTVFAHFHTVASLYLLYVFSWSLTGAAEIAYFVKIYRRVPARGIA